MTRPSRVSVGPLVRHMAHTTCTPTDLLGDTLVHLLHPEAPRCDGDPATYLLPNNRFPVEFRRPPYDSPVPMMNLSPFEDMSGVWSLWCYVIASLARTTLKLLCNVSLLYCCETRECAFVWTKNNMCFDQLFIVCVEAYARALISCILVVLLYVETWMVILSWCLFMAYVTPCHDALFVEYDDPF